MYARYERGHFGNRALTWTSREAMVRSGFANKVALRYKDPRGGGSFFRYDMSLLEADAERDECVAKGADPTHIVWCESVPTDRMLLQGELQRSINHWDFTYTTERGVPNRPNMWKEGRHASGLLPLLLCRAAMWPKSYDNLMELFDAWPDAVVEFSCLETEIGSIPGHNTIFWEVRHY